MKTKDERVLMVGGKLGLVGGRFADLEARMLGGGQRVPLIHDTYQYPPEVESDPRLMLRPLDGAGRGLPSYRPEWKFKNEGMREPIDKVKRKKKNKEQRKARRR